jgi:hypothetical protein
MRCTNHKITNCRLCRRCNGQSPITPMPSNPVVGLFFGRGFTTGQAAQRPPKKNTDLPLAGPGQARSLRLSPSRSTACRRDLRRRCRTQHPSCYLRQALRRRQTHWRVTSNWPPSPCPLHGATQPLPTPVEHTSAHVRLFVVVEGFYILYTARRKRTSEHHPRGKGEGEEPPPPSSRSNPNRLRRLSRRSRRSRPRNLGRTGRRRRGAHEDAMW